MTKLGLPWTTQIHDLLDFMRAVTSVIQNIKNPWPNLNIKFEQNCFLPAFSFQSCCCQQVPKSSYQGRIDARPISCLCVYHVRCLPTCQQALSKHTLAGTWADGCSHGSASTGPTFEKLRSVTLSFTIHLIGSGHYSLNCLRPHSSDVLVNIRVAVTFQCWHPPEKQHLFTPDQYLSSCTLLSARSVRYVPWVSNQRLCYCFLSVVLPVSQSAEA